MYTKVGLQTCCITFSLPSKLDKENRLKQARVIAMFLSVAKRRIRKEKYEETKTNFEDVYLSDGLVD